MLITVDNIIPHVVFKTKAVRGTCFRKYSLGIIDKIGVCEISLKYIFSNKYILWGKEIGESKMLKTVITAIE